MNVVVEETLSIIKKQIEENPLLLYMKGNPQLPQCGFSKNVVDILNHYGVNFAHVYVLANPEIRQALPAYANWPTFPQLYINGQLVGGSDIITELHETGELKKLLQEEHSK